MDERFKMIEKRINERKEVSLTQGAEDTLVGRTPNAFKTDLQLEPLRKDTGLTEQLSTLKVTTKPPRQKQSMNKGDRT